MASKSENPPEELYALKIIGRVLLVLAFPILIINAVLLNMEDKNLPMIGLLLGVSSTLLIVGLILSISSCLLQEQTEGKRIPEREQTKKEVRRWR